MSLTGTSSQAQRGVALLTALVILAIATTLSIGMLWHRELDTRRTANILQGEQAWEYALGAEAWAEQILRRDMQSNPQSVNLTQDWAMQLPPLPVEGGSVKGQLQDLQGLFNLNNLASHTSGTAALAQLQRLLFVLNLDPNLANAIQDWVSPGDQPRIPGGAKDEYYTRLTPPYQTAERPMSSVSELLLVKGVTPEVYLKLLPYVWALPSGSNPAININTSININTAPAPVIASLNNNISLETAEAAVQARAQAPFLNTQQLQTLLGIQIHGASNAGVPLPVVGLTSHYFRLTTQVEIGSSHLTLYSLLYVAPGSTYVLRRTLGTL